MEVIRLNTDDIRDYDSTDYEEYYSFKTHLINRFPDCNMYVAATPIKGIGKSHSAWFDLIIPSINNDGLGALIIRWTETEVTNLVKNLKSRKKEIIEKLNFDVVWLTMEGITILARKEDNEPVIFFASPTHFKSLKGLTIIGNLKLKYVYWDEFLLPNGIYIKPKEVLESFWQVLGSLFRNEDFIVIMTSNLLNPNNPFSNYMFKNIGWPNYGKIIVNHTAGVVIDYPKISNKVIDKYSKTTLFKLTKINPIVHKQMFSTGTLNESVYDNLDYIIPNIYFETIYETTIKIGILTIHILGYYNNIRRQAEFHFTDIGWIAEPIYAGDKITSTQTGLPIIPNKIMLQLISYLENFSITYSSVEIQEVVVNMLLKFKDNRKELDWNKKE